jgi:Short chain fatty acid transporter
MLGDEAVTSCAPRGGEARCRFSTNPISRSRTAATAGMSGSPFWMLPLLGILGLKSKDLIGYTAIQVFIRSPKDGCLPGAGACGILDDKWLLLRTLSSRRWQRHATVNLSALRSKNVDELNYTVSATPSSTSINLGLRSRSSPLGREMVSRRGGAEPACSRSHGEFRSVRR